MTTSRVVTVGLIRRIIPKATPAKEIWDRVSAIMDCRFRISKRPIMGVMQEIAKPARSARWMKSS